MKKVYRVYTDAESEKTGKNLTDEEILEMLTSKAKAIKAAKAILKDYKEEPFKVIIDVELYENDTFYDCLDTIFCEGTEAYKRAEKL